MLFKRKPSYKKADSGSKLKIILLIVLLLTVPILLLVLTSKPAVEVPQASQEPGSSIDASADPTSSAEATPPSVGIYTSFDGAFSVAPPAAWEQSLDDHRVNDLVTWSNLYFTNPATPGNPASNIGILFSKKNQVMTMDQIEKAVETFLSNFQRAQLNKEWQIIPEVTNTVMGGRPARIIHYEAPEEIKAERLTNSANVIFFVKDARVYVLYYFAQASFYSSDVETFKNFVDSFQTRE